MKLAFVDEGYKKSAKTLVHRQEGEISDDLVKCKAYWQTACFDSTFIFSNLPSDGETYVTVRLESRNRAIFTSRASRIRSTCRTGWF